MTVNEYQKEAMATLNPALGKNDKLRRRYPDGEFSVERSKSREKGDN